MGPEWERRSRRTTRLTREWRRVAGPGVALEFAAAGILAAVVTGWFVARKGVLVYPLSDAVARAGYVAVYVGAGAYIWNRNSGRRLGALLMANGFLFSFVTLDAADGSFAHTVGWVVWAAWLTSTAYLFLSIPRGRLESGLERYFVAALVLSTATVWTLVLLLSKNLPVGGDFTSCAGSCPPNAFQVVETSRSVSAAISVAYSTTLTISLLGLAMLVFAKSRTPSRLRRRAVEPLSIVLVATIVEFVLAVFLIGPQYPGTIQAFRVADGLLTFAIPAAIIAGQLRAQALAAAGIGRMVVSTRGKVTTPVLLQKLLREAVGDPTLTLVRAATEPGLYVDAHENPYELDDAAVGRASTMVIVEGRSVAGIVYDPLVDVDSAALEGLAATAQMLLENAQLITEVRASRGRLASVTERERRRIERDLHDGAQQHLFAIQMKLGELADKIGDSELARDVATLDEELIGAVSELRDLARGVYPAVLRLQGIGPALGSATAFAPLVVRVFDEGVGRFDPAVEFAVYFSVMEAVQNAVRHAGPDAHVRVTLRRQGDGVVFRVVDNGMGFDASSVAGSGLLNMRDRVEAFGGELSINSSPGHGTAVEGQIPVWATSAGSGDQDRAVEPTLYADPSVTSGIRLG